MLQEVGDGCKLARCLLVWADKSCALVKTLVQGGEHARVGQAACGLYLSICPGCVSVWHAGRWGCVVCV